MPNNASQLPRCAIAELPHTLIAVVRMVGVEYACDKRLIGHSGNDTLSTWLLRQQAIVLRGGVLRWRDAQHDAPELALRDIRIAILNDGYDHRLALQAPPDG